MTTRSYRKRYDIPAYTTGWFQLGWSDDLRVGQLKKVHQFGRLYTMFRGADGQVGVIDEFAPISAPTFLKVVVSKAMRFGAHTTAGASIGRAGA